MYRYDDIDGDMLADRAAEFREQCRRRLAGEITEDQFKPLRLMNGLYLQLHAYMLRIAIPYGTLNGAQLRALAHVARTWDKGYGHFTTRTNLQLHWIKLRDAPDILDELAKVGLHAIQTSGNCIRNLTADPHAGATADEVDDPRIWAEAIRQWSTFHPEFSFLPRKFKIAVTAARKDRAAIRVYDIGLRLHRGEAGELSFEVLVGGGLGRLLAGLAPRQVSLALPRFRVTSGFALRPVLAALGMPLPFSPQADFSGITAARRLRIDEVAHQAYIDVNEEGTEAAAATAVIMRASARFMDTEPPVELIVDRPFLFAITDAESGLPLFLGRVTDPAAG